MSDTPEKPGQIIELIPKIMADIGSIGKDHTNAHQHYNFRGIDDVFNCVGPVLVKHKVFIVPKVVDFQVSNVKTSTGKDACRVVLRVEYRFFAPDGSHLLAVTIGEAMDTGDKAANKAMAAAMKYAVWQTFCIPTIGVDSEVDSHEMGEPPPPATEIPADVQAIKNKAVELFGTPACLAAVRAMENPPTDGIIVTMAQATEWRNILNATIDEGAPQ